MLIAPDVHQVEFVYKTALLQHLEGAIHGHPIQLWIHRLSEMIKALRVQMFPRLVDQIQQDLALASEPNTFLLERVPNALGCHEVYPDFTMGGARRNRFAPDPSGVSNVSSWLCARGCRPVASADGDAHICGASSGARVHPRHRDIGHG
jgi:hypothetical protein